MPSETMKFWEKFERRTTRRFGDVVVRIPPWTSFFDGYKILSSISKILAQPQYLDLLKSYSFSKIL